jgi:hypothetical protein
MKRIGLILAVLMAASGCASGPVEEQREPKPQAAATLDHVTTFSSEASGELPSSWEPMVIFKQKKRTEYRLVKEQGKTVLRAYSANASSGLMQHVSIEPLEQPWLQWQWKIATLGDRIAHAQEMMEDAPARIILGFDGDKGTLPFSEQILFETARVITGHDFPYATLMYEWHGKDPIGTIRQSKRSSRIRTLVVESGADKVGQWQAFERNIVEDFERAYGEKPGRLIGVGILTDSDYTGETVETWYGDIRLLSQKK